MSEPKLYKFKWANYDLALYQENLRNKARALRRQAELLLTSAQQIEEVAEQLAVDLVEHEPTSGPQAGEVVPPLVGVRLAANGSTKDVSSGFVVNRRAE
jgi:hypothetical protein